MQFEGIADKKRVDFILSVISHSCIPGAFVLDVGCGNGIISRAVATLGYRVDAIDASEKTINAARLANPHPNISYQLIPADAFQPPTAKYDAIICSEVLEHLPDPGALLKILHRSLKAGGILIVTVPNGFGPREMFVTKPVQYLQTKNTFLSRMLTRVKTKMGYTGTTVQSSADDLSHIHFFTLGHLRKLALENSFSITTVKASNFMEQVFPFSLLTRRSPILQRIDCGIADRIPLVFTSGFMTVWRKI